MGSEGRWSVGQRRGGGLDTCGPGEERGRISRLNISEAQQDQLVVWVCPATSNRLAVALVALDEVQRNDLTCRNSSLGPRQASAWLANPG